MVQCTKKFAPAPTKSALFFVSLLKIERKTCAPAPPSSGQTHLNALTKTFGGLSKACTGGLYP